MENKHAEELKVLLQKFLFGWKVIYLQMPQTIVKEPLVLQCYLFFTAYPKPQHNPKGMTHSTVLHSQTATVMTLDFSQHPSSLQVAVSSLQRDLQGFPRRMFMGPRLRFQEWIFSSTNQEVSSYTVWLFHISRKIKLFLK